MKAPRRFVDWLFVQLQLRVVCRRPSDFVVGADRPGGAYLLRWYLTPWRRWQAGMGHWADESPTLLRRALSGAARLLPNLYLHCFLRDDDDRALHDHPSWAASLILRGSYVEHTIARGGIHQRRQLDCGMIRFLPAGGPREKGRAHRIELLRHIVDNGDPAVRAADPVAICWTLFLFGPTVREWGFHCPDRGWVHWKEFTAAGNSGEIGQGCD